MNAEYITPTVCVFNDEGDVDYDGCARLIDYVIEGGVDGIVLLGSNGEFFHLSLDEKRRLIDMAVETIGGRVKLYVGTGAMNQQEAINLTRYAHAAGADAALVIPPYYFELSPNSMEAYYDAIASASDGAIMLYNYPEFSGNDVTPDLALRLVERHENIIGYKDSVPDVAHTRRVIDAVLPVRAGFRAYSGFDENFAHNVMAGGSGSIGALSNLVPEVCAAWTHAVNGGAWEEIVAYQRKIDALMELYTISTPFMSTFRYALNLRGFTMSESCRAPFAPLDDAQRVQARTLLEKLEII
ncbi:dihydrodipicolinate synthase family protein [uncultured Enorma sp.]|uniref:dihydrodipicolinate synthase family protein n=1 Tax=uncultured Enorma sp. TaxID=1714346 RepID=UPI0025D92191|nr:dihydrodipicolinate synthase family protein [uncultured Enorma sp.]